MLCLTTKIMSVTVENIYIIDTIINMLKFSEGSFSEDLKLSNVIINNYFYVIISD
jgi:hypothetical protein